MVNVAATVQLAHPLNVMQLNRLPASAQLFQFAGGVVHAAVEGPHIWFAKTGPPTNARSASRSDNSKAPPEALGDTATARASTTKREHQIRVFMLCTPCELRELRANRKRRAET